MATKEELEGVLQGDASVRYPDHSERANVKPCMC